jgi:Zn-dependent M28 family amino/carboxypeptidase
MSDGEIYNGADDDGSGTVAIMEIAEAFQQAVKDGHRPKRSVVFLHMTGEEKGLLGSEYYTNHDPLVSLENTVTNLNIDMIGRIDPNREEKNRNYIYLIGSDIISQDLHDVSEKTAKEYSNLVLDYRYNDPKRKVYESGRYIENNYYYRSDHYNFAVNNIPIIFYFSGTHVDYHKPTDTADKIEYDLLQQRTKLIFHTTWELANRKERIKNK